MSIKIREYCKEDITKMIIIWNDVIEDGIAFPQTEFLTKESGIEFFSKQSFTGIAYDNINNDIVGLYILHPNNIGRCGHMSNASYVVEKTQRGKGIGKRLVYHSLKKAKELGFKIMQFNAVVKTNKYAIELYEKVGFIKLGVIPKGFLMKNGVYEDIILYYYSL